MFSFRYLQGFQVEQHLVPVAAECVGAEPVRHRVLDLALALLHQLLCRLTAIIQFFAFFSICFFLIFFLICKNTNAIFETKIYPLKIMNLSIEMKCMNDLVEAKSRMHLPKMSKNSLPAFAKVPRLYALPKVKHTRTYIARAVLCE